MLNGSIPTQLCQLKSLKILDLSRNKLHGSIPRCIENLEGMILKQPVSMQSSKFIAEAPPHIWSNEFLTNEDSAPSPMGDGWSDQGLHGLNLSENQLEGEIPQLIGNMKSLESLDISHNQLSGKIPNTMSAITSLSFLNLSHNNFSGPFPKDNQFSTFNDPPNYAYNP
ncbi:unnamed protein product [Vicia faba]|uniref:Uncharacterized protein n=1 Tax=Vicia faba TaxID=3906 RepID=A0AAV1A5P0_VICFA|nr:unnamed protein product [Vicia faba]